jgi:predicted nucleic acid-binding protein
VLLRTRRAEGISRRILADDVALHAPHLLDVEVAQVLRRYARAREVGVARATQALADFMDMRVERYPMEPLLGRIWALRDNVTAYDAAYIALAEALDAPVVTCDARLASSTGHGASIEVS